MIKYLPWIALAVVIALLLLRERDDDDAPGAALLRAFTDHAGELLALLLIAGGIRLLALLQTGLMIDVNAALRGVPEGFALAAVMLWTQEALPISPMNRLAPLGFGLAALPLEMGSKPTDNIGPAWGMIAATLLGLLWTTRFRTNSKNRSAIDSALALAMVAIATYLGFKGHSTGHEETGMMIGVFGLISCVVGGGIGRKLLADHPWYGVRSVALLVVGAWFIAMRMVTSTHLGWVVSLAALVACVAYWQLADEEGPVFPFLLTSILWIALATFAFSDLKAYGMALASLSGILSLAILGNRLSLLTIAPLASLTLYRFFREMYPDVSRAFDIGQHYAVIGILCGVLLTLMPIEWIRSRETLAVGRRSAMLTLTGLALVLTELVLLVFFGAKGAVGLLVGFGIGAMIGGIVRPIRSAAIDVGITLMAVAIAAYGSLAATLDFERNEKMSMLLWSIPVILGLLVVVRLVSGAQANRVDLEPVPSE